MYDGRGRNWIILDNSKHYKIHFPEYGTRQQYLPELFHQRHQLGTFPLIQIFHIHTSSIQLFQLVNGFGG